MRLFERDNSSESLELQTIFDENDKKIADSARAAIVKIRQYLEESDFSLATKVQQAKIILRELKGFKTTTYGTPISLTYMTVFNDIKSYVDPLFVRNLDVSFTGAIYPANSTILCRICPEFFSPSRAASPEFRA